jgi:hypothetical protein
MLPYAHRDWLTMPAMPFMCGDAAAYHLQDAGEFEDVMATAPTVDDLQEVIARAWTSAGVPGLAPPAVLESLVFFSRHDRYSPFAVVDGHGGNCYRFRSLTVRTIDHETPGAAMMVECRIGEFIHLDGSPLLLIARDGGPLAEESACSKALAHAPAVMRRSTVHLAVQDKLAALLKEHREILERDIAEFARHAALSHGHAEAARRLAQIDSLERAAAELRLQHTARSVERIAACLDAEEEAIHKLRDEVHASIDHLTAELAPHRELCESLKIEALRDSAYVAAERTRLENAYVAALRSPSVILMPQAEAELASIERLQKLDGVDSFCLRRRLYTLRLNALHSARQPGANPEWNKTVARIETQVRRIRSQSFNQSPIQPPASL